ncbi:hypothetical protein VTI74DRAFT_5661 [Chaetomium olivicolor]
MRKRAVVNRNSAAGRGLFDSKIFPCPSPPTHLPTIQGRAGRSSSGAPSTNGLASEKRMGAQITKCHQNNNSQKISQTSERWMGYRDTQNSFNSQIRHGFSAAAGFELEHNAVGACPSCVVERAGHRKNMTMGSSKSLAKQMEPLGPLVVAALDRTRLSLSCGRPRDAAAAVLCGRSLPHPARCDADAMRCPTTLAPLARLLAGSSPTWFARISGARQEKGRAYELQMCRSPERVTKR